MNWVDGTGALRVAIFHASLPEPNRKLGGVEVTVHRLANALVRYEHCKVTLFSCGERPGDALYRHNRVGSRAMANSRLLRLAFLPARLNFVNFDAFDVLHLHGDDWFYFNRRIPTVRTLHGSALFEARSARNWRRKLLQYGIYPLEHASAQLATISLSVGTEAAALYHCPNLADNGVDTDVFRPQPKDSEPLLMYVGHWSGRKRGALAYQLFVDAIAPRWPTARLFMVCDQVPDHPQVINGGFPSHEVLADWLARAWVFLYPSTYEGFGISYVEALASGTSIVTSPNSGASYVLEEGRYGMIRAEQELVTAVDSLLQNEESRRELEQRGLQRAKHFSWRNVSRQHVQIYRQARERFCT